MNLALIEHLQLESASTLIYTANNTLAAENFAPIGAFKNWLLANEKAPLAPWISPIDDAIHNKIIAHNGGYAGYVKWYIAALTDINSADEAKIPDSAKQIKAPCLLVTCTLDPIGLAVLAINETQPYATNFRMKQVESGHFVQIEASEETNQILDEFFTEVLVNATRLS
jgi:soluble epoxide hydrolase/lipid-phosphate phosphatase